MLRYWNLGVIILLMMFLFSHTAYGYIDPNTTSVVFGILTPIFTILLVVLGFLTRPFRKFFSFIIKKVKGRTGSEDDFENS